MGLKKLNQSRQIPITGEERYVTKGCPKKDTDLLGRVFPQPRSFKHYVRCCEVGSGPVEDICHSEPCQGLQTYDDAVKICVDKGMGLCAEWELDYYCCNTGCWYDEQWVWVSNIGRDYLQNIYR